MRPPLQYGRLWWCRSWSRAHQRLSQHQHRTIAIPLPDSCDSSRSLLLIQLSRGTVAGFDLALKCGVNLDLGDKARRFICSMSGHADIVCIDGRRIFVKCRHCGRRSTGLQVPATESLGSVPRMRSQSPLGRKYTPSLAETMACAATKAVASAVPAAPATH